MHKANEKTRKTQIVILGGGFAGVEAARYLDRTAAKRADVEVTLVSRDNFTLFTPMLDEVASGDLEPGPDLQSSSQAGTESGRLPESCHSTISFWRLGRRRTIQEFQVWPDTRSASRPLAMR
jgi:hypothetical protein